VGVAPFFTISWANPDFKSGFLALWFIFVFARSGETVDVTCPPILATCSGNEGEHWPMSGGVLAGAGIVST